MSRIFWLALSGIVSSLILFGHNSTTFARILSGAVLLMVLVSVGIRVHLLRSPR